MKNWIGKWVMFVAICHTTIAIIFFGGIYKEMFAGGLVNSVTSAKSGLAAWFLLFGGLLFLLGLVLSEIEKTPQIQMPKSIGITLLVLSGVGIVLMPASGFWLLLPVVFPMFKKQQEMNTH